MKSARQQSRSEKKGPRETHQVAAGNEFSPESQIKLKIFHTSAVNPEINSRFRNFRKTLIFFQPVYSDLTVTECRQKEYLYVTFEEEVNHRTSKGSQKEKKQCLKQRVSYYSPQPKAPKIFILN